MSQIKFQKLINDFSPESLVDVLKSHDFFRIKHNLLVDFNDKQFIDFIQLGDFDLEDNTNIVVICARSLGSLNERTSRKTQYDISKKILKNFQKSRAGIFVYYDSKGDFRISLIYADYVGIKVNYSTFRRFTYFVSKEQTNTTFFQQVSSFNFTKFEELREMFSVEKVTKEFFKKYRDLFLDTREDFDKNEVFQNTVVKTDISTSHDFVKKMMGQIVFLYFVQKKGWLGVRPNENWGSGDQAFLRTLFTTCEKSNKNYFNDYLEPMFYEALASEKRGKDDLYEKLNCRIPFLNGGLFESIYKWENSTIYIPNKTIGNLLDFFDQYNFTVDENTPSDQEISVDPEMLGKIFENLLEVKDRKDKGAFYTPREIVHYMCRESLIQHLVSENTAPEERIRKLFEIKDTDLSLIVEDEKQIEIVKRLPELKEISVKVDSSLRNIKIVDPAVGSGAFPMGMLNEISSVRYYLNTNFLHKQNTSGRELSLYDIKKETLENCIYAVDIEPGAVEITKVRFWLALIVEYESNDSSIAPPVLPNLDYKIMQGNSLLEEYEGIKLFDEKIFQTTNDKEKQIDEIKQKQSLLQKEYFSLHTKNELTSFIKVELETRAKKLNEQLKKLFKDEKNDVEKLGLFDFNKHNESKIKAGELKSLQKKFFETNKKDKKEEIKKQIEKLQWELIEATLREHGKISELEKIQELKKSKIKPFFLWKLHFADVFEEKGGFDVVIANPPYVGESGNKEIFRPIAAGNLGKFYQGKMDLFYFFFHLALDLGKPYSLCAFISTNYYITASGANKLRADLKARAVINNIVNFNELKIFESALGQHNMITIFSKDNNNELLAHTCTSRRSGMANAEILNSIFSGADNESDYYFLRQIQLYDGEEKYMRLSGIGNMENPIEKVLIKMKKQGVILKDVCEINQGLVTGANKVSLKHIIKYKFKAEVGDGIFVLSKDEAERINEKEYLKPWYKNSDISRWITQNTTNQLVIYLDGNEQTNKIQSIIKHLEKYRDNLQERREVHKGSRNWYDLWRSRTKTIFESEKIVAPYRSKTNTFGYNEIPWYAASDVYFLGQKDEQISLKFVLGLLNSKLYYVWLCQRGKRKGGILELFYQPLSEIPIMKISIDQQKPLIGLVESILKITKTDDYLENTEKQAKVRELEHQIDELVYKLYGLTNEEIQIVECKK
ncbi:Eco57I restriction-modification methylase domain-containing protein [Candidatus Falkowbacteria bacterium]|nr:MAG: Eco57I restriction-modification methylase domain-containing protein [Candidatus Falkowbacteria bacterium]